MAVLSDNESGEIKIRQTLREFGIESYFSSVITSIDIGFAKPDKRAFSAAIEAIGQKAVDCVFVGHDIDELDGAREAGLYCIAFNYHHEVSADTYLEKFSDLIEAIH